MKKIRLIFFASFLTYSGFAQLTITPNYTATQLASTLVATSGTLGVNLSNAILTCDSTANGEFNGVSNLGISNGIILSTGSLIQTLPGVGFLGNPTNAFSSVVNQPGDASLAAIVQANTYDACVLEFDMQPVGNFVEFEYVFGSDEYPAFNCSAFNDVFGFFISGPGYTTPTNIALVPSTTTPVSINSINDGSISTCGDTTYYVDNTDTIVSINGFTTPLIATATVTPNQTYHLKLAITDVMDGILNSVVVLKANSLKSGNNTPAFSTQIVKENNEYAIFPTNITETLNFTNKHNKNWNIKITDLNGRMVYQNKFNSNASINLNQIKNGIYLIQLTNLNSGETFLEKIIKE